MQYLTGLLGDGTAWWEWRGRVVTRVPGRRAVHIADLRGADATSLHDTTGDGTDATVVARRALLIVDPMTGRVCDDIEVPWSDRRVAVDHLWLDPVVEPLGELVTEVTGVPRSVSPEAGATPGTDDTPMPGEGAGDPPDRIVRVHRQRFWSEPFPLSARQWPRSAPGPMLEIGETLDLTGSRAWATGTLVRLEPWWPCFELGDTPGHLLVHLRGERRSAWRDVRSDVRDEVERRRPEFAHAPHRPPAGSAASIDHLWAALSATRRVRRGADAASPVIELPGHPTRRSRMARLLRR